MTAYQQTVLNADREAENGLVTFLRAQTRTQFQSESVDRAQKAVALGLVQYQAGTVDFTRITQLEQNLVLQQNTLAVARGEIAQGLIQTYRALGGGWENRQALDAGTYAPQDVVLTNVVPLPRQSSGPRSAQPKHARRHAGAVAGARSGGQSTGGASCAEPGALSRTQRQHARATERKKTATDCVSNPWLVSEQSQANRATLRC